MSKPTVRPLGYCAALQKTCRDVGLAECLLSAGFLFPRKKSVAVSLSAAISQLRQMKTSPIRAHSMPRFLTNPSDASNSQAEVSGEQSARRLREEEERRQAESGTKGTLQNESQLPFHLLLLLLLRIPVVVIKTIYIPLFNRSYS